jgi:hypothetical protein
MNDYERSILLLTTNGWMFSHSSDEGIVYAADDLVAVEIMDNEIVLLDDTGDFLHLPLNYYALVGALIDFRQLRANYKGA